MKTASFHTTARKAILATLQTNRDDLRVRDTREWRFLTDEEFRRLGHAKPSDVSYAGDLDDYGMFDGTWGRPPMVIVSMMSLFRPVYCSSTVESWFGAALWTSDSVICPNGST